MGRLSLPLCLLMPGLALAQSIGGPVSGSVFDPPTGAIRPVVGVAQSAYLGTPVVSGIEQASVSPDGSRALIVRGGDVSAVSAMRSSEPRLTPLAVSLAGAAVWAWAPDSSRLAAALADGRIAAIRWNGDDPVFDIVANAPPSGSVSALGLDSHGRMVVGIRGDSAAAGIYLVNSGGQLDLLAPMSDPVDIAFDGIRIAALDRSAKRLLLIGAATGSVVLDETLDAGDPFRLALLSKTALVYIADRQRPAIVVYDLQAHAVARVLPMDAPPTCMQVLAEPYLYRLSERRSAVDAVFVFDTRTEEMFFIPAGGV